MESNIIGIDFKESFSFGKMTDKLIENNNLSFASNGYLYFIKNNEFKYCKFKDNLEAGVPISEKLILNEKVLKQIYHQTNIYISNIITSIEINEVKKYLEEGKTVMFSVGNNTWILELEDDMVYLDYTQVDGVDENNYASIFTEDILIGIIEGIWHVIELE